ncbi:MAG: alkaline phosphatase family protein [Nitrospirae bacterium]|nr:alkaline phosphatase family protein [Nitrospirota bacterium]
MFGKLFKKAKNKVIVLGIDGVPYSLLVRFINEGIMPNLSGIVKNGTFSAMTASIPEVSSTSWSTFMTGVNPGKHGIYGFMELQKDSYKWYFPNSSDIKSETLWDIAGKNNRKSIVLNLPSTYPARQLNGILTAGFVALDLRKATYPESAYEYLKGIDYRMDVDTQKAKESSSALSEDIDRAFAIRRKAILHFLDSHEWDLFIGVITETDRLHHYLWNALEDKSHSEHNFFVDFYKRLDSFIGEMYKRAGDDIPFIIVSDHGFTTIKKEVYLNWWLREKGYLQFKKDPPESFEDMLGDSKVFALDPARFYIHLKDKYQQGCVEGREYEAMRQRLKEDLVLLEVDGEKVVKSVFLKEELYSGGYYNDAPDLLALPYPGYDLKGAVNKTSLTGRGFLTGGHTRDNAVFFINRNIKEKDINIVDVGPTIISLLGVEHKNFDGRCLV